MLIFNNYKIKIEIFNIFLHDKFMRKGVLLRYNLFINTNIINFIKKYKQYK